MLHTKKIKVAKLAQADMLYQQLLVYGKPFALKMKDLYLEKGGKAFQKTMEKFWKLHSDPMTKEKALKVADGVVEKMRDVLKI